MHVSKVRKHLLSKISDILGPIQNSVKTFHLASMSLHHLLINMICAVLQKYFVEIILDHLIENNLQL